MFWFSLDTLILNPVVFSLCMTLNFEDKLRARKSYCRLLLVGGAHCSMPSTY